MKVICYGDSNTYGYDPRSYIGGRYPAGDRWVDLLAEKTGWEVENRRCALHCGRPSGLCGRSGADNQIPVDNLAQLC